MKTIVLSHAGDALGRARHSLSQLWRRDAEAVRRKAVAAERKAAAAVAHGWGRLKPKVVHIEHRMHDGVLAAMRKLRLHA